MNTPSNFSANLQTLRQERHMSLCEFSAMLDIPRSTLQAILETGQTSLDTACRIAEASQIPLSVLTGGELPKERADIMHGLLLLFGWYSSRPIEEQKKVANLLFQLMDLLQK